MAIKDAEKFIKELALNKELRLSLYNFNTYEERTSYLKDLGFSFSPFEFEESINHLKSESATKEQADLVEEIQMMWVMLNGNEQPSCSPAKCSSCSGC